MSPRLMLTVLWVVFTTTAFAQTPLRSEIEDGGYASFPILECPATNEAIKDFRSRLIELKKAIKEEANCEGISADVAGLTQLVTKQRDDIMALITKGQSQGLSEQEQGKVETYVQSLTEKTSNLVAVLTGNDACFDEDKKGMSLELITTLIGEGSKILSIVGGPEVGSTVQVAGEVITGFLKAMKTIQENRQGYEFEIADQKMAYAESLCSLFDYRRELQKLIDPYDSVDRLQELESVLKTQINVLRKNCVECREIILAVETNATQAREGKAEKDMTIDALWPKSFETDIIAKANDIDKLFTRRLGTHTYRALKTLSWIPLRIRSLEDNSLKADLGLTEVVKEMASIEKFMVNQQAPLYLRQLIKDSRFWQEELKDHIISGTFMIGLLNLTYRDDLYLPELKNYSSTPAEFYGQILEALDVAREQVNPSDQAYIRTYFTDLESKARNLNISYDVVKGYCTFFENANWYRGGEGFFNRGGIRDVCGSSAITELEEITYMFTNYRSLMSASRDDGVVVVPEPVMAEDPAGGSAQDPVGGSGPPPDFGNGPVFTTEPEPVEPAVVVSEAARGEPEVVAQDWVESLSRVVDDMTNDSDYVRRQFPAYPAAKD